MWAIFSNADTAVPLATMGESWVCWRANYLKNASFRAGASNDSQRESCVWGTVYIVPKIGDLKPLDFLARYHGYVACKYYLKDSQTFSDKKAFISSLLEMTLMPLQGLNDLAIFVPDIDRQC